MRNGTVEIEELGFPLLEKLLSESLASYLQILLSFGRPLNLLVNAATCLRSCLLCL